MPDDLPDLDQLFSSGVVHNVTDCPRCGTDHPGLLFRPYTVPTEDTHWALCPTSQEPVQLLLVLT